MRSCLAGVYSLAFPSSGACSHLTDPAEGAGAVEQGRRKILELLNSFVYVCVRDSFLPCEGISLVCGL